jgi:Holliday junction resolvasome RuvABC endonuclease subunit
VIIVGIDGGLAKLGMATIDIDHHGTVAALGCDWFESEPLAKKMQIEAAHDYMRRGRDLAKWLGNRLDVYRPNIVALESISFTKSYKAALAMGLGVGVIAAELERRSLPVVGTLPKVIRTSLHASGKEEAAHREAKTRCSGLLAALQNVKPSMVVHVLDALCVALWGGSTNVARALLTQADTLPRQPGTVWR